MLHNGIIKISNLFYFIVLPKIGKFRMFDKVKYLCQTNIGEFLSLVHFSEEWHLNRILEHVQVYTNILYWYIYFVHQVCMLQSECGTVFKLVTMALL